MSSPGLFARLATAALLGAACGDPVVPPERPAQDPPEGLDRPGDAPALVVRPRLVNLGRLRPGAGASRRIEVQAVPHGTLITGAGTEGGGFALEPGSEALPARRASFTLRFEGSRQVGPVGTRVVIAHRDADGTARETAVAVAGTVVGDVRVTRGVYLHTRRGRFEPREVLVGRRSGRPVGLRSVEDPDGLLAVTLIEPRSKLASFRLEVADPAREDDGAAGHPLLLHVDDAAESPIRIEYRIDTRGD